jgi:Nucleotide modification associated domain 3
MNGLLVRVGADSTPEGGAWNGPVDVRTRNFAYVPIPEATPTHPGLAKPYQDLAPTLAKFGMRLPGHLAFRDMHLDPDFKHLTYGDQGERAKQLQANLQQGDIILFYASLADIGAARKLVYALVGLFVVEDFVLAATVPTAERDMNAHTRRILQPNATDLIIRGQSAASGRLQQCLPFGEYRNRAYRARRDLLATWGGLSVKDGYVQRSARLPRLLDPQAFLLWLNAQRPVLIAANN